MTFKFHCTCGQKVSATEDMIGTSALCPRCGSKVIVPRPSGLTEPAPAPAPPRTAAPAPPPQAPARTTPAAAPMTVVPRPMALLKLTACLALVIMLGTVAFVFRSQLNPLPKIAVPVLVGVPLGMLIGSIVIAAFLRLAVRIVGRFDLSFFEAWLVTLFTSSLDVLAVVPVALAQFRMIRPEEGAKFVALTGGVDLLLTIVVYSFLIRNALGRPIGIGRGILTYLLRGAFLGVLGGIAFGIMIVIKLRS